MYAHKSAEKEGSLYWHRVMYLQFMSPNAILLPHSNGLIYIYRWVPPDIQRMLVSSTFAIPIRLPFLRRNNTFIDYAKSVVGEDNALSVDPAAVGVHWWRDCWRPIGTAHLRALKHSDKEFLSRCRRESDVLPWSSANFTRTFHNNDIGAFTCCANDNVVTLYHRRARPQISLFGIWWLLFSAFQDVSVKQSLRRAERSHSMKRQRLWYRLLHIALGLHRLLPHSTFLFVRLWHLYGLFLPFSSRIAALISPAADLALFVRSLVFTLMLPDAYIHVSEVRFLLWTGKRGETAYPTNRNKFISSMISPGCLKPVCF